MNIETRSRFRHLASRLIRPPQAPGAPSRTPDARDGVALIIVLGLLSVLLITAVAFAIFMRIERAGAANFRHGAAARHMLQAGLTRAVLEIHDTVGEVPYADFEVQASDDGPAGVPARILSAAAMEYVPRNLHDAVRAAEPHWIPLLAPPNVAPNQQRLVGRYGYVIVNLSGLLDANHAGGEPRGVGGDPAEIQLNATLLPEVVPPLPPAAGSFTAQRNSHLRYETMPELKTLNTGMNPAQISHFALDTRDPVPTNFTQRAYIGGSDYNAWDYNAVSAALTRSGVPNLDVVYPFIQNLKQHQVVFAAMADYIDPGRVPVFGFNYPSIKPVPKLCQITVYAEYSPPPPDADGNYTHTVNYYFSVGAAAPFRTSLEGLGESYAVNFKVQLVEKGGVDAADLLPAVNASWSANGPLQPPAGPYEQTIHSLTPADVPDLTYSVTNDREYPDFTFSFRFGAEVLDSNGDAVDKAPTEGLDFLPNLDQGIYISGTIDQATITRPDGPGAPGGMVFWSETFDPRFNWHHIFWIPDQYPVEGETTIRDLVNDQYNFSVYPTWLVSRAFEFTNFQYRNNFLAIFNQSFAAWNVGFMDAVPGVDNEYSAFRLPNAPGRPFETVGELSYMPIAPWSSIRLQGFETAQNSFWNEPLYQGFRPPHRVLDHFTLLEDAVAVSGRVNANTPIANVLASVYAGMSLREMAPPAQAITLSPADALQVADRILDWRNPPDPQPPRYFRELSDLGQLFEGTAGNQLNNFLSGLVMAQFETPGMGVGSQLTDFDRDAIIRNAAGLFSTRHQHYLVILRADAFAPRFGMTGIEQGAVLATGHAIAEVWRDALPDPDDDSADPIHPTNIRLFKMLDP